MKNNEKETHVPEVTHQLTMVVNRMELAQDPAKFAAVRARLLAVGVRLTLMPSDTAAK